MRFGFSHPAVIQSAIEAFGQIAIIPNPPHSLASDSWKGLVFSLMAGNRNAEALAELGKIPLDVRRQLESDVEWVQGIASLYFAVGDTPHATLYLHRVENFYLAHRTALPASLEVQHAWLLYNLKDDFALYPLLVRLDARQDLTADLRQQVETLWAQWAVRRANQAIESGQLVRGVEILQAASEDYPDNMTVRLAVAGAYARVGRSQEAVTLFKSLNMNEAWLRIALAKYPNDPIILGLAARFEQARGNNERASAFWRAAIAAMPPGSGVKSLDYGLVMPQAPPTARPAPATRSVSSPRNLTRTSPRLSSNSRPCLPTSRRPPRSLPCSRQAGRQPLRLRRQLHLPLNRFHSRPAPATFPMGRELRPPIRPSMFPRLPTAIRRPPALFPPPVQSSLSRALRNSP
jgi:tetratricopeptide (TPR) repeat protein